MLTARFFSSALEFMILVEVGDFHLGNVWFKMHMFLNIRITLRIPRYSYKKTEIYREGSRSVSPSSPHSGVCLH